MKQRLSSGRRKDGNNEKIALCIYHGYPEFSFADTADYIVIAIAPCSVGIDCEQKRNYPQPLYKAALSSEECLDLAQLPEDEQSERFRQFWTAKEAIVKAEGTGFTGIEPKEVDALNHPGYFLWYTKIEDLTVCVAAKKELSANPTIKEIVL